MIAPEQMLVGGSHPSSQPLQRSVQGELHPKHRGAVWHCSSAGDTSGELQSREPGPGCPGHPGSDHRVLSHSSVTHCVSCRQEGARGSQREALDCVQAADLWGLCECRHYCQSCPLSESQLVLPVQHDQILSFDNAPVPASSQATDKSCCSLKHDAEPTRPNFLPAPSSASLHSPLPPSKASPFLFLRHFILGASPAVTPVPELTEHCL